MVEKRLKILRKINFIGKDEEYIKKMIVKHGLSIDELAALRYIGKMTMFQYAKMLDTPSPFMNILEKK